MSKQTIIIANLIDWSKAFTDVNGTFYCGTTDEQKQNGRKIVEIADLVINTTDLHPLYAPEFNINGGLFPAHNAVLPEQTPKDFVYCVTRDGQKLELGDKTLSPELTGILNDALNDRKTGIIVPRGVYFQSGAKEPFCSAEDIEKTFGQKIITADDFIKGDVKYIIQPKQFFDATRLDSDISISDKQVLGIPNVNYNVYSLLKLKYTADQYNLVFINTGVVEGICRLHSSVGLRQMFPSDRIINIVDATTPLAGIGLGYETKEQSRDACTRVCKDIGIEYMTTEQVLNTKFN